MAWVFSLLLEGQITLKSPHKMQRNQKYLLTDVSIPDFWLPGRLITAAAKRAELAEILELADLLDKALEGLEELALLTLEDWALLAGLLWFEEPVSDPELSFSESLMLIYILRK